MLEQRDLLSFEDTAFHLSLIRQCASLLNVGAVPFSTFVSSYNGRFYYSKEDCSEINGSVGGKRMKKEAKDYCLLLLAIDHFTVVGLEIRPLNSSEAGVDLVLIQTSLLLLCKSSCSYAN